MVNNPLQYPKDPPKIRGIFYLRSVLILSFLFFSLTGSSQSQIKFTDAKKSFGFVKKGEVVVLEYEFSNTGNEPLIITETKVECSCTSVEFPKQPIAPNQKSKITVKFDTHSVYERQDRTVQIFSNAKNSPASIRFKGVVLKN